MGPLGHCLLVVVVYIVTTVEIRLEIEFKICMP